MAEVAGFVANVFDRYHHTIGIQADYFIYTVFSIVIGDLAVNDGLFYFMGSRSDILN
jgi:hypothetical protein